MSSNITKLPDGSAFLTATIMSHDEAMKLPVRERPLCFRISSEMYHAVFEAIGEASLCWRMNTCAYCEREIHGFDFCPFCFHEWITRETPEGLPQQFGAPMLCVSLPLQTVCPQPVDPDNEKTRPYISEEEAPIP